MSINIEEDVEYEVGSIGNYYGCLLIKKSSDGRYLWGIENYNGTDWEEIPRSLFETVVSESPSLNISEGLIRQNIMKNLLLALVPTFIVWLITLLTMATSLPTFTLYFVYCVSYLMVKEVGYEGGK